ncbi:hypothetical protein AB4144_29135, partial [Rhizobiaceae sp. 2RAB30]
MKPLAENVSRAKRRNSYFQGDVSDHFDGRVFFNPGGRPPGGFVDLLRWQLGGDRAPWPTSWPSPFPSAQPE